MLEKKSRAKKRLSGGDAGGRGNDATRGDGQNDPEDDVGQAAGAGAEEEHEPDDADDRGVHVEIVSEAGTDAGDFLVGAGAHEAFVGTGGGRKACSRAGRGLLGAAVVAEFRTDRDFFAAVWASHDCLPVEGIRAEDLLPAQKPHMQSALRNSGQVLCYWCRRPSGLAPFYLFYNRIRLWGRKSFPS